MHYKCLTGSKCEILGFNCMSSMDTVHTAHTAPLDSISTTLITDHTDPNPDKKRVFKIGLSGQFSSSNDQKNLGSDSLSWRDRNTVPLSHRIAKEATGWGPPVVAHHPPPTHWAHLLAKNPPNGRCRLCTLQIKEKEDLSGTHSPTDME